MWRIGFITAMLCCAAAQATLAQQVADLQAVRFDRAAEPAARIAPPAGEAGLPDQGDARLMLIGGAAGGAIGYLTGLGVAAGAASVLEARDVDLDDAVAWLAALPSITSAIGAATGAGNLSCTRLVFGSFYPLDSCAAGHATLLGALPGAVALYLVPRDNLAAVAGAVAAEAVGAAVAGLLVRERSEGAGPRW